MKKAGESEKELEGKEEDKTGEGEKVSTLNSDLKHWEPRKGMEDLGREGLLHWEFIQVSAKLFWQDTLIWNIKALMLLLLHHHHMGNRGKFAMNQERESGVLFPFSKLLYFQKEEHA